MLGETAPDDRSGSSMVVPNNQPVEPNTVSTEEICLTEDETAKINASLRSGIYFSPARLHLFMDAMTAIIMTLLGVELPYFGFLLSGEAKTNKLILFYFISAFSILGFWKKWFKGCVKLINRWASYSTGEREITVFRFLLSLFFVFLLSCVGMAFSSYTAHLVPREVSEEQSGNSSAETEDNSKLEFNFVEELCFYFLCIFCLVTTSVYLQIGVPKFGKGFCKRMKTNPSGPEATFVFETISVIVTATIMFAVAKLLGLFTFLIVILLPVSAMMKWYILGRASDQTSLLEYGVHKERLCALTDGVFAITATLLILEAYEIKNRDDILNHRIEIGYMAMNFTINAVLWVYHHHFFLPMKSEKLTMRNSALQGRIVFWNLVVLIFPPLISYGFRNIFRCQWDEEFIAIAGGSELEAKGVKWTIACTMLCMFFLTVMVFDCYFNGRDLLNPEVQMKLPTNLSESAEHVREKFSKHRDKVWWTSILASGIIYFSWSLLCLIITFIIQPSGTKYVLYVWVTMMGLVAMIERHLVFYPLMSRLMARLPSKIRPVSKVLTESFRRSKSLFNSTSV